MVDWTTNKSSHKAGICPSNLSDSDRETHDYYATEPKAVRLLLKEIQFSQNIWECACGELHLSNEMSKLGKNVFSSDIIQRNAKIDKVLDFLAIDNTHQWNGDIITNPPYRYANEFILKALSLINTGNKLALFLPIRYLEGKARKQIFINYPPKIVLISSSRIKCAINADFVNMKSSLASYCWIVWQKGYSGHTIINWFN